MTESNWTQLIHVIGVALLVSIAAVVFDRWDNRRIELDTLCVQHGIEPDGQWAW